MLSNTREGDLGGAPKGQLLAVVGLGSQGIELEFNFGVSQFKFQGLYPKDI